LIIDLDRKAARFSILETIAASSVVAGIVGEDWDEFGKFISHPAWESGRVAIGGAVVALGIILEILFSSRSSSAERKIRDWYALRVSELNLKAEQERLARVKIERSIAMRGFSKKQYSEFADSLAPFAGDPRPIALAIISGPDDFEANRFRESLRMALVRARLNPAITPATPNLPTPIPDGYMIATDSESDALALAIWQALLEVADVNLKLYPQALSAPILWPPDLHRFPSGMVLICIGIQSRPEVPESE
jgi:hypothetical protein